MKKLIVLIVSFFLLSMFFAACGDIANITVPQDSSPSVIVRGDNSITWTGLGIDSLVEECEEGYIHWVLNQAKNVTSAELVLGGSGSGSYDESTVTPGGVYHFYTPYFDLETLEASIFYEGELGKNSQFVISDYCTGEETMPEILPVNGDFETCDLTGWTVTDTAGSFPLVQNSVFHTGTCAAYMGDGNGGMTSIYPFIAIRASIEQTIAIPDGVTNPTLSLYYLIDGDDYGYDGIDILIDGSIIQSYYSVDSGGWQQFTHDLTSYIGSSIILKISAWTLDPEISVHYYVDDIIVTWD